LGRQCRHCADRFTHQFDAFDPDYVRRHDRVFSVILAVAVGNGAQVSVTEQIATLGSNMAIVVPQPDSGSGSTRPSDRGRLTERDGQAILRQISGVSTTRHTGTQRHHASDRRDA
jgi:hypothetical protein